MRSVFIRRSAVLLLVGGFLVGCATASTGRLNPPATSGEIMALSMMHGLSMIASSGTADDPAAHPTCSGTGADKAHAVEMSSAHGRGNVKDVLPCLRQLYPGASSTSQAFAVEDNRYYTIASLKDASGTSREVCFDVTQWAEDYVREMRKNG